MPTVGQLHFHRRKPREKHTRSWALMGGPQRKAVVYKIAIMTPRKPNSAKRTFAKVRIMLNLKRVFAKIPGIGEHFLQPHSVVLVRGHGPKDSPGINYHLIRGVYDFIREETFDRGKRRSKFGRQQRED